MMSLKTNHVLKYIIRNYPYPYELTKTRTTKLVYLSDWYMAMQYGRQITDISWFFDHYGPYVSDILDEADEDTLLRINKTVSAFGSTKYIVGAKYDKDALDYPSLSYEEQLIIDRVIEDTKQMSWNEFIDYVYSTYPIVNSNKYYTLDLVRLAIEFNMINP